VSYRIGIKSFLPQSSLSASTTSWNGYGILEFGPAGPTSSFSPMPGGALGPGRFTASAGPSYSFTRRRVPGSPTIPSVTSPGAGVTSPSFSRQRAPWSPTIPSATGGRRRISPVPLPTGSPPDRYRSGLGPRVGGYRAIRPPVRPYRRMPTGVRPPAPLTLGPRPPTTGAYYAPPGLAPAPAATVAVGVAPRLARLRTLLAQAQSQGFRSWKVQGQRGKYRGQWVNRISKNPYPARRRKSALTKAINKERRRLVAAGLRLHVRALVRQFFGEPQQVNPQGGQSQRRPGKYWGSLGNVGIGPGMF
jgi:hypothetical protein